jgi:hypothetical protein
MSRVARIHPRTHVALWLLLSLHVASRCDAAAARQVALQASLATWTEASERCAALGPGLAPHKPADGLLVGVATGHTQCTSHGSDVTVLWVKVGDGPTDEQCHGLVFNHTSRQAHLAGEACDQRHCFLCLAPQAGLIKSTTGSVQSGQRRLMDVNTTNCTNPTGRQIHQAWLPSTTSCRCCLLTVFRALHSERQLLLDGASALGWGGWAGRSDCQCDGEWTGVECNSDGAVTAV